MRLQFNSTWRTLKVFAVFQVQENEFVKNTQRLVNLTHDAFHDAFHSTVQDQLEFGWIYNSRMQNPLNRPNVQYIVHVSRKATTVADGFV